jgi:hypothetical protein
MRKRKEAILAHAHAKRAKAFDDHRKLCGLLNIDMVTEESK